jgi:hypothetical protein
MRYLALALVVSGCVSFKSVNATATLGDDVAARERALDRIGAWCRAGAALGSQDEVACRKLDGDTVQFRLAARRIGAWSQALRNLANDQHASAIHDDVAAAADDLAQVVWKPPSLGQASLVGAALDALFKLVTTGYRQRALATAVHDADPHIGTVVGYLRAVIKIEVNTLDVLVDQTETAAPLVGGELADGQAGRAGLLALAWRLRDDRAQLLAYDRALQNFREAHAKLARPGFKDAAIYGEIVESIKSSYQDHDHD